MSLKRYQRTALIGLDGSGKSANIDKMKNDSDYAKFYFVWARWKPTILKPAYWMLEKKISKTSNKSLPSSPVSPANTSEQAKLNTNYHTKSGIKEVIFKNPVLRALWMAIAIIDYFIQFHIKTIGLSLRKKSIIFDRFYLDLFVDQGINFGYSPEKIEQEIRKYQWLFPKMDQLIYIRVSPETCFKRKNDIPNLNYLLKRYEIYEQLSKNSIWITVDGEQSFETVNADIKKHIFNRSIGF